MPVSVTQTRSAPQAIASDPTGVSKAGVSASPAASIRLTPPSGPSPTPKPFVTQTAPPPTATPVGMPAAPREPVSPLSGSSQ